MKNSTLLISFALCYSLSVFCKAQTQFQRTIGGTNADYAYSMIQTTDGGYAMAGYTTSFGGGGADFYIVKLDGTGTLQWSRTVGGTNIDYAESIIQTTDGGYAVAGYTTSFGAGNWDFYIVKLDGTGTLQWSRTVGGTVTDISHSIIQTTDGGYAMAGYTTSFGAVNGDFYIVKLDGSGSLGAGSYDMYIVKLDSSGALQWSRTVGGTSDDYANSIIRTVDGGYAVAGQTVSFGAGNGDIYSEA